MPESGDEQSLSAPPEEWGVYVTDEGFRAEQWHGNEGLHTLAANQAMAESLAAQYNHEREEEMAKGKGSKKAKREKKAKAEKVKEPSVRLNDKRLPQVGSEMVRQYQGKELRVKVTENGLIWNGDTYQSLSGLAKAITGYKTISGYQFFSECLEGTEPKKARKPRKSKKAA